MRRRRRRTHALSAPSPKAVMAALRRRASFKEDKEQLISVSDSEEVFVVLLWFGSSVIGTKQ